MFDLYLLSFNCARHLVSPESLAPSFFDALPNAASVPDVVAISLQEVAPIAHSFLGGSYLTPYLDRITTTVHLATDLRSNGSERLEHVATRSLGMTALVIFAKPELAERIRWIQAAAAGVGFWNMGNKGAVGMRIGVACPGSGETLNLAFIAAHLAPMEVNVEARNRDWEKIVRNLVFVSDHDSPYSLSEQMPLTSSQSPPTDSESLFAPASHLFFAGDLNYRTSDRPPLPDSYKSYPQPTTSEASAEHFSHLLKRDQLNREREANRTLHNLHELPINFPPTYKYSVRQHTSGHKRSGSDVDVRFDWAEHRHPSWCDRILFSPPSASSRLEAQIYTALPVQPTSDHRPVVLSVRVDNRPLSREETQSQPPFPTNPNWRVRQDAARRWELIVGILSYLALTKKGNAMIVVIAGIIVFTSWYLSTWLRI
ncbi:inositol 5-phosphatase-like protein [Massarina eburnea CBS 473.64]|uniref:Inositol 5-phosphatase-like protein n=1 Tax=Massarina eburnea CBS 473.64 TaxID=1395130 RepID=A0A6A6SH52_9PLEO|nr:inositol 5-phosphatase-like protein [Massarina eburnea CBS 473.64]